MMPGKSMMPSGIIGLPFCHKCRTRSIKLIELEADVMEPRGLMGGFYRISEWIMRLSVINLLWLICSIPFVIAASGLFFANGDEEAVLAQLYSAMLLMAIIAPFTLFPATAAMFSVARKWVMGETDVALFKTFFKGYKENYKQAMIGGIIYCLLLAIMIVDFIVYRDQINVLSYVFIAFLLLLVVSLFNFFSMLVHYHMKTFQLLKNAVLITIGKPFRSLSTAIMCGAVLFISTKWTFLIPFFMGSIIAYLSFWNFHIIYQKLQDQVERAKREAEEAEITADLENEESVKGNEDSVNK